MESPAEQGQIGPEKPQRGVAESEPSESDGCSETALFSAVLSNLTLYNLPIFCARIRKEAEDSEVPIEPVSVEPVIFGSYHALFPIQFHDGVRWILKVPVCGTREHFNSLAALTLRSEALTMRLMRRETSVPIPDVLAFDATLENELGCPFILMSFVCGKSLYDCWFDKQISDEELSMRRSRALEGVARAMVQLNRFSFPTGGRLSFDQAGNLTGRGPMRFIDHRAMLERLDNDDDVYDETPLYFEAGPFADAQCFYCVSLDRAAKEPKDSLRKGMQKLLRLLLSWAPEPPNPLFVLAHPDLGFQNVLVSEDGSVQGLIDWDGVAAVPRLVGNERYPSWLTRDWDPAMYAWSEDMEKGIEPDGLWEDSPDTLALHRKEYTELIQRSISLLPNVSASPSPSARCETTQKSLYVENLLIAADNPMCTFEILENLSGRSSN